MDDPQLSNIVIELVGPLRFIPVPPLKATPEPANNALVLTFADPGRHVRRHILNETGRAVYGLLDGERTVGEIIETFARRFPDVPREQLQEDVVVLIRSMQREGVVRQVRAAGDAQTGEVS